MALGGQGGGVLASWLVKAGEAAGYIAQSTSVPGVAQRTGATIYYVELFPEAVAANAGKRPVLALMPAPGDVDVVIAAELMEAGRALARGLLGEGTTLIASTHRVFAISEKIAPGDGRQDAIAMRAAASRACARSVFLDMEALADEAGAAISAVLLGALAGCAATQISRSTFERTIRESGRAIERNLRGFALGYAAAAGEAPVAPSAAPSPAPELIAPKAVRPLFERVRALPAECRDVAFEGLRRVIDFQDIRYGGLYLERLARIASLDADAGGFRREHSLTKAAAAKLALAMSYDDVIRVADLKTRSSRRARVLRDVRAADGQIVRIFEYMHPRLEEFCDLLPRSLGSAMLKSGALRWFFNLTLGGGRRVETTSVRGFLTLQFLASLRPIRRISLRYATEQKRIERWLGLIAESAARDYAFAVEIAGLPRLIKGYGDTHDRGVSKYERILEALDIARSAPSPAAALRRLRDCALQDEDGVALAAELSRLGAVAPAAA